MFVLERSCAGDAAGKNNQDELIEMTSIASTIPSAISAPPGPVPVPGGAADAARQSAPVQPIAPPSAISGRAEQQARSRAAERPFRELARYVPEMESAANDKQNRARARAGAVIQSFSVPFMTQLISQSNRGLDYPMFDATHEQGFAAYQAASEHGTTYLYGLLDSLDVAA